MDKIIDYFYNKKEGLTHEDFIAENKCKKTPLMFLCSHNYSKVKDVFHFVLSNLSPEEIKYKNSDGEDALFFACENLDRTCYNFVNSLIIYYSPFTSSFSLFSSLEKEEKEKEEEHISKIYKKTYFDKNKRILFNYFSNNDIKKAIDRYNYSLLKTFSKEDFLNRNIEGEDLIVYVSKSTLRNSHRSLRYIISLFKDNKEIVNKSFNNCKINKFNKNYIKLINIFKPYISENTINNIIDKYFFDQALYFIGKNNIVYIQKLIDKNIMNKFCNQLIINYLHIWNYEYYFKPKYNIIELIVKNSSTINNSSLFHCYDICVLKIFTKYLTYEQMCEKNGNNNLLSRAMLRNLKEDYDILDFLVDYYNEDELFYLSECGDTLLFDLCLNDDIEYNIKIEIIKKILCKIQYIKLEDYEIIEQLSKAYIDEENNFEEIINLCLPYYSIERLETRTLNVVDKKTEQIIKDYLMFGLCSLK